MKSTKGELAGEWERGLRVLARRGGLCLEPRVREGATGTTSPRETEENGGLY